jgi:hypothetical protein
MAHNKKRKAEANGLDEMDRELYTKFRTAANSISSLYTAGLALVTVGTFHHDIMQSKNQI